MRRMRLPAIVLLTIGLVAGVTAAALAYFSLYAEYYTTATSTQALAPRVITSGTLDGLYPGAHRTLDVIVENPNEYPISVQKIDAHSLATASGCSEFAVSSDPFDATLAGIRIAPAASHSYRLSLTLASWADSRCAGQRFQIKVRVYAGSTS